MTQMTKAIPTSGDILVTTNMRIRLAEQRALLDLAGSRALREPLRQAERFGTLLEEVNLRGAPTVPEELAADIRRFVAEHDRGLLRRLGDPVATLDALFDLQERLQARMHSLLGTPRELQLHVA